MRKRLLIPILAIALLTVFVSGCKFVQVKEPEKTTEIAVDIAASTIGYYVGMNNSDLIPEWNEWLDKILALEQGDSTLSLENLLVKGFDLVVDEPFLKMQLNKLMDLLEFPELQPPNVPFLTGPYMDMVKLILGGFREGLEVALAEAQK